MRYSVGSGLGPRCNSRYIRTCCGMAAATPWRTPATTRGRCRPGSGTRTSSTPCATPSWHRIGLGTFGVDAAGNAGMHDRVVCAFHWRCGPILQLIYLWHFCRYGCYVRVTLRLRFRGPLALRSVTDTLISVTERNGADPLTQAVAVLCRDKPLV